MNKPCELCKEQKKLVNSHIIPKSFFTKISEHSNRLIKIGGGEIYLKRMPQGIYDQLVCDECERKFSECDGYIYNFLDQKNIKEEISDETVKGYVMKDHDIDMINYFVGSLLWRASISGREEFEQVDLGDKYNKKLINFVNGREGFPDEIKFIVVRFTQPNYIVNPQRQKIENINFYKFFLGEWGIYVKVDNRPLTGVLEEFVAHNKEIWVIEVNLKETNIFRKIKDMSKKMDLSKIGTHTK